MWSSVSHAAHAWVQSCAVQFSVGNRSKIFNDSKCGTTDVVMMSLYVIITLVMTANVEKADVVMIDERICHYNACNGIKCGTTDVVMMSVYICNYNSRFIFSLYAPSSSWRERYCHFRCHQKSYRCKLFRFRLKMHWKISNTYFIFIINIRLPLQIM